MKELSLETSAIDLPKVVTTTDRSRPDPVDKTKLETDPAVTPRETADPMGLSSRSRLTNTPTKRRATEADRELDLTPLREKSTPKTLERLNYLSVELARTPRNKIYVKSSNATEI